MKILIFALSGIGDALMFTPSINFLRRTYPLAQIDALVMFGGVRDIYERNKGLSNVLYFNFMKEGAIKSLQYLLKLRGRYDVSINVYPANRKEYNIFSFIVGAPERAAIKYLRKNTTSLGFLNNITVTENDFLHNVEQNLNLCAEVAGIKPTEKPPLDFPLLDEDNAASRDFLDKNRILKGELVIGFHPGCATFKNHINRRWEPEKFSELGRKLISQYNARILIFGGPEEKELKQIVLNGIDMPGALTVETPNLAQSTAIMQRCDLFITNDSSLMHIASALKLKVIAIIGPTNIHYIHPWQTDYKMVTLNLECSPCFFYSPKPLTCYRNDLKYKCIKELTVDMVFSAAESFLSKAE